jgi:rod shape-determining protein MreC
MIFLSVAFRYKPTVMEEALSFITVPLQKFASTSENWIVDKINYWKNINELSDENKKLKLQNEQLAFQIKRLELIEVENIKLSKILSIKQQYPEYSTVGARVISKDTGNWSFNFMIDKGSSDGLEKNMVVISEGGGIVGRIIESGLNYSKVMPIIDDTSAVSSKNVRTEDTGMVKGYLELAAKGLTKMEYIDTNSQIMKGDEIITSNLGDIYPPGLTIGYVVEINPDKNGLTKHALVETTVDFTNIETVLVIDQNYEKIFKVK